MLSRPVGSRVAALLAAVCAVAVLGAPASAQTTIGAFAGPVDANGPFPTAPATIGTFNFTVPNGYYVTAATVTGHLGNAGYFPISTNGTAPLTLSVDGVQVASCADDLSCNVYGGGDFSYSFTAAQLPLLNDGTAALTYVQTGPAQVHIGPTQLSVQTAVIQSATVTPEPGSVWLVGTGLTGLAGIGVRRRRR